MGAGNTGMAVTGQPMDPFLVGRVVGFHPVMLLRGWRLLAE
jgi:hypothetical protein